MPEGPVGGPRPLAESELKVQVSSSHEADRNLTEQDIAAISDGRTLFLEGAEYEVSSEVIGEQMGEGIDTTTVTVYLSTEEISLGVLDLIHDRLDQVMEIDVQRDELRVLAD